MNKPWLIFVFLFGFVGVCEAVYGRATWHNPGPGQKGACGIVYSPQWNGGNWVALVSQYLAVILLSHYSFDRTINNGTRLEEIVGRMTWTWIPSAKCPCLLKDLMELLTESGLWIDAPIVETIISTCLKKSMPNSTTETCTHLTEESMSDGAGNRRETCGTNFFVSQSGNFIELFRLSRCLKKYTDITL
jgi:hypothetical protein